MTEPAMWNIKTTAEHLGVSVALVRRMVADNHIPHVKVASRVRFHPTRIAEWLKAREIEAVK